MEQRALSAGAPHDRPLEMRLAGLHGLQMLYLSMQLRAATGSVSPELGKHVSLALERPIVGAGCSL